MSHTGELTAASGGRAVSLLVPDTWRLKTMNEQGGLWADEAGGAQEAQEAAQRWSLQDIQPGWTQVSLPQTHLPDR